MKERWRAESGAQPAMPFEGPDDQWGEGSVWCGEQENGRLGFYWGYHHLAWWHSAFFTLVKSQILTKKWLCGWEFHFSNKYLKTEEKIP